MFLVHHWPVLTKLWWVQSSTASFRQETAAPEQEMGGLGPAPRTQFTILWQQGWPEQKTGCQRQRDSSSDPQNLIVLVSIYRLTSYYSETFHFKDFFDAASLTVACLVNVTLLCMCMCVHAENSFDEISRRNSWPTNTMTTVSKGTEKAGFDSCDNIIISLHRRYLHHLLDKLFFPSFSFKF